MPQIDLLLQAMTRFGAQSAVMRSGEKIALVFPTGSRYMSQTTSHEGLVGLVEEILPRGVRLNPAGSTEFTHDADGVSLLVRVDAGARAWQVSVVPASAPAPSRRTAPPSPPMSAPAPAAPKTAAAPAVPTAPAVRARNAIEKLLLQMLTLGASDLHLSAGNPPFVRVGGVIQPMEGEAVFTAEELLEKLYEIIPERNREEFERRNDTDFAYSIPGASRFRVNYFCDRRGPGAAFRAIPFQIRSPEELGLPPSVLELCDRTKGLILVTGPTGCGKSTTLATLVDHVNRTRKDHIVTIEDPIEFVHENKSCLVNQREVHSHTDSFKDALRAALREDPDIVLVGEMRDLETIAIAVETAETGHLVFGTLHTSTAPSTIDRVIDQFPADRQDQIRQMLAGSLVGVIAQVLCRRIGGGRVAAYEILVGGSAVSNLIREKKTFQIYSVIQTGKAQGMTTLNDSLMAHVRSGVIEAAEAQRLAVNKTEMAAQLGREAFKPEKSE